MPTRHVQRNDEPPKFHRRGSSMLNERKNANSCDAIGLQGESRETKDGRDENMATRLSHTSSSAFRASNAAPVRRFFFI